MRLLSCVVLLLAWAQSSSSLCTDQCATSSSGWNSNITILEVTETSVYISWSQDEPGTVYQVTWAEQQQSDQTDNGIELGQATTSSLMFNISTELVANSDYQVRVCRQTPRDAMDDCGNCLLCFTTLDPLPATTIESIFVSGPETFSVIFNNLFNDAVTNYLILCEVESTREVVANLTVPPFFTRTEDVFVPRLSPETTYVCRVAAFSVHGMGPFSPPVMATTPPRTTDVVLLLMTFEDSIEYSRVEEVTADSGDTYRTRSSLLNMNGSYTGLDYHLHQNEIYYTVGTSVFRLNVSVSKDGDGSLDSIAAIASPEVILANLSVDSLGSLAVDWVYNEIYWIEYLPGDTSRIMRGLLTGGLEQRFCVAQFSNRVRHIIVNPVNGYFFWSDINGLHRASLGLVRVNNGNCPTQIAGAETIISDEVFLFTFESDRLVVMVAAEMGCQIGPLSVEAFIGVADLNGGNLETFIPILVTLEAFGLASYAQRPIFTTGGVAPGLNVGSPSETAVSCGGSFSITNQRFLRDEFPTLVRVFGESQQPLPVPPFAVSNVRIIPTDNTATISWDAPTFPETSFSSSAYDAWDYEVEFNFLGSFLAPTRVSTTGLNVTLTGLQPGTLYEVNIIASGLGTETRPLSRLLVFTTLSQVVDLLVATQFGVIASSIDGSSECLDPSRGSAGVAHDSYTDTSYWVTDGSAGEVISFNSQTRERSSLVTEVNNPFSVRLDWVTKRLFWVQRGALVASNAIMSRFVTDESSIETFEPSSSAVTISTTAIDARNGYLFWLSDTRIHRKSLSGIDVFEPCSTDNVATALTVDPDNMRLYWISNSISAGSLTINQLVYRDDSCIQTMPGRELSGFSFSSSATVLAYASETLFIATQTSSVIHSIPAAYAAPGRISNEVAVAVNTIELSSSCQPGQGFGIADIAFDAESTQPLPAGLDPLSRVISEVTPLPVQRPPFLGSASSGSTIVIEWDSAPSLLSGERLIYILRYSINGVLQQEETLIDMTSLSLSNQQPSTTINASVTVCSFWNCGPSTEYGVFTSAPPAPGAVSNARVFVYRPQAIDPSLYSALVYWDPPDSIIDSYTIVVRENGINVNDIYQPVSLLTSYSVLQRATLGQVTYFLRPGQNYEIEISARNPTGPGPSTLLSFSFTGPDYPRQVLAVGSTSAAVVGDEPGIVTLSNDISNTRVLTDTIAREAYYYDVSTSAIFKSSLRQAGALDSPLLPIDPSLELLAMAYDWVAREIYYATRDVASDTLQFYRLSVLRRSSNTSLFPNLVHSVTASAVVQLTMDPVTGLLIWTQTDGSRIQLNTVSLMMQQNTTSSNIVSTTTSRRKRQTTALSSLDLTSVIALDSVTSSLLLATTGGDIYSCNVSTEECMVAVDAMGRNDISLPPTDIAVDDLYIYWSGNNGVFAMARNSTAIELISSNVVANLAALSPGSQPLGPIDCLAPDFDRNVDRVIPMLDSIDTTYAQVFWESPSLPERCNGIAFSYPPLLYRVFRSEKNNPFAMRNVAETFDTDVNITGLEAFCGYNVNVAALNEFIIKRSPGDTLVGLDLQINTLEGVPDMPLNIQANVFGTANVTLIWETGLLRGDPINESFFVVTENGAVSVTEPMVTLDLTSGITRGVIQDIEIIVNNGRFNSTPARERVVFWLLAPAPFVSDRGNTSLDVTIQLARPNHEDIRLVTIQYCVPEDQSVTDDEPCVCPGDSGTRQSFQAGVAPASFIFTIEELQTFTQYCVQSIAEYRVGQNPPAEVTPGEGRVIRTDAGTPDTPTNVRLMFSTLFWEAPSRRHPNGIERYQLIATPEAPDADVLFRRVESDQMNFNLESWSELIIGVRYQIRIRAINPVGAGNFSSELIEFTREIQFLAVIIGASVGGTLFISLCLCFVLFCVWFVRLSRPKEQEIRSLSYMYGPDHELRNLRINNQERSGHYNTWSRDDYVCTDEDLDQLSKFPRHNLKLENFIDRGEFGEVYQGTATDILGADTGPTPVAVKTLRKNANHEDQKKFLSEASLMSNFNHPNIVKVLGVCLDNDPVYIIMELMPAGDLLKFLRDAKRDHGPALLTLAEQVQISLDVAHGCQYLEQQHFIHRDLAARNCLVSSKGADRVVKIGDFGLARDLYSSDYYQVEGQRRLPVRWMAPEALLQGKFAVESDIWSFGVLLWEIMSLGNQPYPGRINQEVLQFVTAGGRLDKPDKCPSKLYHLMQNCWKNYPSERPHFEKIVTLLTTFLGKIKRPDSIYHSDTESDEEEEPPPMVRGGGGGSSKTPSRTPSIKAGFMNLARSGSFALRNSFRRHGSIHKREENNISQLPEDGNSFRERGPF